MRVRVSLLTLYVAPPVLPPGVPTGQETGTGQAVYPVPGRGRPKGVHTLFLKSLLRKPAFVEGASGVVSGERSE